MKVDVLQRKGIRVTFFRIKAHRNPLHHTDIIDGALLVKIRQSNMAVLFIYFNRCDRCRDLLDQAQFLIPVIFICPIDEVLQS